jgi:hypothetical protein
MTRQRRTPEQLRGASEHLLYEFRMLSSLARAMELHALQPGTLHDAALESFTVHARILLHFLYAEKPRSDDVIAEDYFDDATQWERLRPQIAETIKGVDWRVGKEVAHLTYARLGVTPEAKVWPVIQIANEISRTFDVFRGNVSADRLDPRLRLAVGENGSKGP